MALLLKNIESGLITHDMRGFKKIICSNHPFFGVTEVVAELSIPRNANIIKLYTTGYRTDRYTVKKIFINKLFIDCNFHSLFDQEFTYREGESYFVPRISYDWLEFGPGLYFVKTKKEAENFQNIFKNFYKIY